VPVATGSPPPSAGSPTNTIKGVSAR
jgi:hypothetical protein